jgi:hypothetical protein
VGAHNEHHLVTIRVLTALDVSAFRSSGVPFIVAATAALVVTAGLIFNELHRDKYLIGPLRSLALLGPMLLLTSANALDCSIPINTVYPLSLVFVIAALVLFDAETESAPSDLRRIIALAVAITASLSKWGRTGCLAPIVVDRVAQRRVVAMAAGHRRYRRMLRIYLRMDSSFNGISDPGQFATLAHLAKMAEYLLAYLGLPISCSEKLRLPALAVGGILLVAGCGVVLGHVLPRPTTRLQRMAVGWVMAALGAALLAAIGRVDQETTVHYALLVAPLQIGLLALALPFLASGATTLRRQAVLLGGGLAFRRSAAGASGFHSADSDLIRPGVPT